MSKDHASWIEKKIKIDEFADILFFQEREIWWCACGANIGHEQDGKGENFQRPVLIIKKFNKITCWALPLTSSSGTKPYHLPVSFSQTKNQVNLSQLKLIDQKRLITKMGFLDDRQFVQIKKALRMLLAD
jgi:mRNA interferase MazF